MTPLEAFVAGFERGLRAELDEARLRAALERRVVRRGRRSRREYVARLGQPVVWRERRPQAWRPR